MEIRDYDHERDLDAVKQIWREVGWGDDEGVKALDEFLPTTDTVVFDIDGTAECSVISVNGSIRIIDTDVPLGVVAGVTTSRVARRLGAARALTARTLANQADAGMAVSALGMFDQGFYDTVGYGTGTYVNRIVFDPAKIDTGRSFRPPKRLTADDLDAMYTAMRNRARGHGGCSLDALMLFRSEWRWMDNPFALGYYDGPGETLSHFFMGAAEGERGPYEIVFIAYQNVDQLIELLSLIGALGDQVQAIGMHEPAEIQMRDFLREPFRTRRMTQKSKFESYHATAAYWQARILDVARCIDATHLDAPSTSFNLTLSDPVVDHLPEGENEWTGVAGDYVVTLGEESNAERGRSESLPTLTASVGAFTRAWLGVRAPTSLAYTDALSGDVELLAELDRTLRMPAPATGWDF